MWVRETVELIVVSLFFSTTWRKKIQATSAMLLYVLSQAINRNGFNFGVSLIEISRPRVAWVSTTLGSSNWLAKCLQLSLSRVSGS